MNLFFAGLVLVLGLVAVAFSGGKAQAEATWAITDLGTLGGLSSLANEINERGQVIGTAETTSIYEEGDEKGNPTRHAFLWENSEMRDLGTLGGPSSTPSDINNRGQIVGWADTKLWDPYFDQVRHAFLWQNGKMRDLGTLGGRWSRAVDINERGQVVGWADTKTLDSDGEQITHAFLWEKGKMRDLGAIGKESSRAVAINERGQVIGTNGTIHDDAFLWEKGNMRDLGTLGGTESYPEAINERGQIVGWAETGTLRRDGDDFTVHAFLWENGRMRDLGIFGRRDNWAWDINERGQVVGVARTWGTRESESGWVPEYGRLTFNPSNGSGRTSFLWQKGSLRNLGTLGGGYSGAEDINERGQVVGWGAIKAGLPHGVIWANVRTTDLGSLTEGWFWSQAEAMNERDQIVGSAYANDGGPPLHAVLWTLERG